MHRGGADAISLDRDLRGPRCEHRLLRHSQIAQRQPGSDKALMIAGRPSRRPTQPSSMNQKPETRVFVMSLDYEVYNLGDVKLQRAATLLHCKLAYETFGALSPQTD